MFKLILIIYVYGMESYTLGAGISQHEYSFDTLKQCEYVRNFYKTNIWDEFTVVDSRNLIKRYVRVSAQCFQK